MNVQCIECGKMIINENEIKKDTILFCQECGSIQKCIDKNDYISRWRKMSIHPEEVKV